MAVRITDLSLGAILAHMEPNKRIYLTARCPSISHTEKSVPLRIQNLKLEQRSIILDGFSYKVVIIESYWKHLLGFGKHLKMEFLKESEKFEKPIPSIQDPTEASKALKTYIFGARTQISVKNLKVHFPYTAVKIKNVENLEIATRYPEFWLKNLEKPLKTLKIQIRSPNNLILYSKYTSELRISDEYLFERANSRVMHNLMDFGAENMTLENTSLWNEDLMEVARDWIRNKRKTGTNLIMFLSKTFFLSETLLMPEFSLLNGTTGALKDENGRFIKDISLCCRFRIDDSSDLIIYHFRNPETKKFYCKMEVLPAGRFVNLQNLTLADYRQIFEDPEGNIALRILNAGSNGERIQIFMEYTRRLHNLAISDMLSKPLSYPNMITVLSYMNLGSRFILTRFCPSLVRAIQNLKPGKIDNLCFKNAEFQINGISFKIETMRKCEQTGNAKMLPTRYDEFRYRVVRIHGDVTTMSIWEKRTCYYELDRELEELRKINKQKKWIRTLQAKQDEYIFSCPAFVKFSITTPSGIRILSEFLEYSTSSHNFMRYLLLKVFNGTVKTRALEIKPSGYIMMPLNSKFQIQELKIKDNASKALRFLEPVLDSASFPLKTISIHGISAVQSNTYFPLYSPILQGAERLNIIEGMDYHLIPKLNIKKVFVKCSTLKLYDIKQLICNQPIRIGSCFVLELRGAFVEHISDLMTSIELRLGTGSKYLPRARRFPCEVCCPINENANARIQCQKTDYFWTLTVSIISNAEYNLDGFHFE